MLYFIVDNANALVAVTNDHSVNTGAPRTGARKLSRWDFKTYADAVDTAAKANALHANCVATGNAAGASPIIYVATDAGAYNAPRFDVIELPHVGAEVSRGFNGDYYPAGKIAKVSNSGKRVETDTGVVFYRRQLTGAWVSDGTWSMVAGHHTDKNPSF